MVLLYRVYGFNSSGTGGARSYAVFSVYFSRSALASGKQPGERANLSAGYFSMIK